MHQAPGTYRVDLYICEIGEQVPTLSALPTPLKAGAFNTPTRDTNTDTPTGQDNTPGQAGSPDDAAAPPASYQEYDDAPDVPAANLDEAYDDAPDLVEAVNEENG